MGSGAFCYVALCLLGIGECNTHPVHRFLPWVYTPHSSTFFSQQHRVPFWASSPSFVSSPYRIHVCWNLLGACILLCWGWTGCDPGVWAEFEVQCHVLIPLGPRRRSEIDLLLNGWKGCSERRHSWRLQCLSRAEGAVSSHCEVGPHQPNNHVLVLW